MTPENKQFLDMNEGEGIRTAVDIVIFNKQGQILLGKRRGIAGENTWAFPGGHQKTGELMLETAKREVVEEIGIDAKINYSKNILAVRENNLPPYNVPHITIMIKAEYTGGNIEVMEPEKCSGWEWFNLDDLPEFMFSGERKILENYKKSRVRIVTDWYK